MGVQAAHGGDVYCPVKTMASGVKGGEGSASRSTLGGKDEGEDSDGPTPHGPSVDETNMHTSGSPSQHSKTAGLW